MRLTKKKLKDYLHHIGVCLDSVGDNIEYELSLAIVPIEVDIDKYLSNIASLEAFLCEGPKKVILSVDSGVDVKDITLKD